MINSDDLVSFSKYMYDNYTLKKNKQSSEDEEQMTGGTELNKDISVSVHKTNMYEKQPNEKPTITRPYMSIFEYTRVITELAKYIYDLKSLESLIDQSDNVNIIVYPCELAFRLLEAGKFDAKINRGYETVWFSDLKQNPLWKTMITNYYKQQHEIVKKEFLSEYELL